MIQFIKRIKINVTMYGKKNPSYWKNYRQKNPQKTERNRLLQIIRNRKRVHQEQKIDESSGNFAKMYSSDNQNIKIVITFPKIDDCKDGLVKIQNLKIDSQYLLIPKIAKMDSSKIFVHIISTSYP